MLKKNSFCVFLMKNILFKRFCFKILILISCIFCLPFFTSFWKLTLCRTLWMLIINFLKLNVAHLFSFSKLSSQWYQCWFSKTILAFWFLTAISYQNHITDNFVFVLHVYYLPMTGTGAISSNESGSSIATGSTSGTGFTPLSGFTTRTGNTMGSGSSTSIGSTSGTGFMPLSGFTTGMGGTTARGSSTSTGSTSGTGFTSRQLHRLMAIATSKMTVKNFISIANCGKSNFKS